mgnify:CR=1 FL=1
MGFRKGARATCWSVQPISDTMTKVNLSTDGKTRDNTYEKDFSGFVTFIGTANAKKALGLKAMDHIVLGDCEVKMTYGEDKKPKYTNYYVYSFEMAATKSGSGGNSGGSSYQKSADEGIDHNPVEESRLPF